MWQGAKFSRTLYDFLTCDWSGYLRIMIGCVIFFNSLLLAVLLFCDFKLISLCLIGLVVCWPVIGLIVVWPVIGQITSW